TSRRDVPKGKSSSRFDRRRFEFRIGISVGDITIGGDDILGDGVEDHGKVQPHFCGTSAQAILKNLGGFCSMAKLVFGMNQSLDGYVDHLAFGPSPALFR